MKTKFLILIIVMVLASIILFFRTTNSNVSDGDLSWEKVQKKGSLIIGLDDTFAPMGFRDKEGQIIGFDIDLAKEVAKRLNLELIFQSCIWNSIFMELNGNKIDLIWNGVSMSDGREQQALFSRPYAVNRMVIVIAEKSLHRIKSRSDLNDKKVAVQSGSPAFDYVKRYQIKELVQYPDNYTALLDLQYGGVDVVVLDEIVADYYITQRRAKLVKLRDSFTKERYGIAFRKSDRALRDKIQEILDAMEQDGTVVKISEKWFGKNMPN
ncbi:MAG: amino acid ABC transporter substrate-binding protein [Coxiellaceae bacterium]|nr:amino acid ABC transporter substrate-binding protein [Coxiellaceae bacterium]